MTRCPHLDNLKDHLKEQIKDHLHTALHKEGWTVYVAANDNTIRNSPVIELRTIENTPLSNTRLLFEIKVVLALLGKPWQCDAVIQAIYEALQPHRIHLRDLAVLLMCMHIDPSPCAPETICPPEGLSQKQVTMRYIAETLAEKA